MMLMQMVTDAVGKPRNYGPTNLEMEEEERRKTEEKMRRENQQRVQEEQKEIEEARQRAVRWEEWVGAKRRCINVWLLDCQSERTTGQ